MRFYAETFPIPCASAYTSKKGRASGELCAHLKRVDYWGCDRMSRYIHVKVDRYSDGLQSVGSGFMRGKKLSLALTRVDVLLARLRVE